MIEVSKGVLKAKMLEYFRKIERTGEELIVTSHRKPVLKVIPLKPRLAPEKVFSDVRGKLKYRGDLTEPTTAEWPETMP